MSDNDQTSFGYRTDAPMEPDRPDPLVEAAMSRVRKAELPWSEGIPLYTPPDPEPGSLESLKRQLIEAGEREYPRGYDPGDRA